MSCRLRKQWFLNVDGWHTWQSAEVHTAYLLTIIQTCPEGLMLFSIVSSWDYILKMYLLLTIKLHNIFLPVELGSHTVFCLVLKHVCLSIHVDSFLGSSLKPLGQFLGNAAPTNRLLSTNRMGKLQLCMSRRPLIVQAGYSRYYICSYFVILKPLFLCVVSIC